MSGCEGEETCEEMQAGMVAKYPEMSEHYIVWSDTVAPIIVAHEEGKHSMSTSLAIKCLVPKLITNAH